jgi:anti-sigma factor RsiW
MSHLDEGTLHALLDGELGTTEVAEITAHLSGCSACAQRHREAKEFRAEADRLIESVELAETQAPRGSAVVVDTPVAPPPRAVEPPVVERPIREPVREPLREPTPTGRPPEPRRAEPPAAAVVPPSPRPAPPRPEPRPADAAPATARSPEPPRAAPRRPRPQPVAEPEAARPEAARPEAARPEAARPEAARPEPWNAPPPPLMIPDNESRAERRFRMMRRLGVAATILVVVGTAALAYKLRPGTPHVVPDDTLNTVAGPTGVVSSLERSGAPSSTMQKADTVPEVPAPSVPPSAADEVQPPPSRQPTALANAPRAEAPTRPKPAATAKQQAPAAEEAPVSVGSAQDSVPEAVASDTGAADSTATQDLADVRRRAAEAMQELDRDRRRDQAAAATAALDAARRRNARAPAPTPAAVPPPAPPTIEQRAGIYLRIGLDEASRQLGGPAHVIEGMSAAFMGLAPGGVDPGADSTRPLVRVVYQDPQGRLILLDQQRLRAGQAPPQGPLAWVAGEVALWLRGEAPADALRALRSRVR